MAQITGINQDNESCATSDGGIKQSYGLDLNDLGAVTYDGTNALLIDGITIATSTVTMAKFVYDDDDSAFYNQEGERDNKKHTYNQQASMKFSGITTAKIEAAEAVKDLCAMFWLHVTNSAETLVQGIEKDGNADGWIRPKQTAKCTVNINTNTGADSDDITIIVDSNAKKALTCSLTTTEIEALVGA